MFDAALFIYKYIYMSFKTIAVDSRVYDKLARQKRDSESHVKEGICFFKFKLLQRQNSVAVRSSMDQHMNFGALLFAAATIR